MNYLKKIMDDKGSQAKDRLNNKLSSYIRFEEIDDSNTVFLSSNVISFNLLATGTINQSIKKGGQLLISAKSKFGKSMFCLAHIKDAQKKGFFVVYLNTEGPGAFNFKTAKAFGIDTDPEKFILIEENSLEECENIVSKLVDGLTREERNNIFLIVDSFGGLVSTLNITKAVEGNLLTKNMQDPQARNRFASILAASKTTRLIISHTFANTGGYGEKESVGGSSRVYYFADSCIVFTGRTKNKDTSGNVVSYVLAGKTHKSRLSVEESQLDIQISKKGLSPFYGLLPDALEGGFVLVEGKKYYRNGIEEDKKFSESEIYNTEFWKPIFQTTDFKKYLETKYVFENDLEIAKADIDNMFDGVQVDSTESEESSEETPKKSRKKKV